MIWGPPFPPFSPPFQGSLGGVFPVSKENRIIGRFGKNYYQLQAYTFFPDLADDYADRLEELTGKKVKVASFQDSRIAQGESVDCGIWLETSHRK